MPRTGHRRHRSGVQIEDGCPRSDQILRAVSVPAAGRQGHAHVVELDESHRRTLSAVHHGIPISRAPSPLSICTRTSSISRKGAFRKDAIAASVVLFQQSLAFLDPGGQPGSLPRHHLLQRVSRYAAGPPPVAPPPAGAGGGPAAPANPYWSPCAAPGKESGRPQISLVEQCTCPRSNIFSSA